jgi:ABC-type transport system involved in cytochrome c biogenesis permease component
MVPTLIFGVAASDPASPGRDQAMAILLALTLASGAIGCVGAAAALRVEA